MSYRLTVRHGSAVEKRTFEELDEAVEAMRRRVDQILAEGPLEPVSGFRDYEPDERVHARLELTSGGLLKGREAGLDVMGDGSLVPYVGVIRKRRLEPRPGQTAFDAVRQALAS